ncbi:UDP-N-acetylmuramate:L-alanyl-gamma-D-glutamyl-meso-diaminopimelate ligase [Moraxella macacae 0408225]|uniref:UDP-N-acetylmuramate--L-alanyl-gamma-D-glutamyl-meso-2,6-diaminoheptandioate ligase n=1 Tax=Moraxella macacae 0408225 TaxID=1230338 RepID=L2F836_9GAMM|nr:UDP-N-acetylmuramate:L-alanyl-gamma-D-glutamyl-meso-diaminopimelate ligase [Moraxella macacae]ELA09202.1 UDP-N-acetylmuramate:L-alanyl-gamma-D-glutamyl-meso-diaminopimelate ligase [Moraxella macacae 0408225]
MHIHFLGICGTFMGSLALLARDLGHTVTGSDTAIYPPMSTQLQNAGVKIMEGYHAKHLKPKPDLVVVGNVCKRGMEAVEYMLNTRIAYTSGPQFLSEHVLQFRHVLAVAGTHGKTTTTTMLAWILQYAKIDTGFLIGGIPLVNTDDKRLQNTFKHSSYLGANTTADKDGYFVIEADEYDSAFFDKRSKFIHYRPTTAILNNLEYDHADIFPNLEAIQTQFHHMVRTIPSNGCIIMPNHTESLEQIIKKENWTPVWRTGIDDKTADWQAKLIQADGSVFHVEHQGKTAEVNWSMSGLHNVNNGLVAIAAAHNVGVSIETACKALSNFAGIKRRMELVATIAKNKGNVEIYDDFAHHPTAIQTTLDGAKKRFANIYNQNRPPRKIWAIIEPRSNTMKLGIHQHLLAPSAKLADHVIWYQPAHFDWSVADAIGNTTNQTVMHSIDDIICYVQNHIGDNDAVIIMSNGGFEGIHDKLVTALNKS